MAILRRNKVEATAGEGSDSAPAEEQGAVITTVPAVTPEATPEVPFKATPKARKAHFSVGSLTHTYPALLLQAAHPRQALITALAMAAAATIAGREVREIGAVFATILVGQTILGWHNDLVDRERDEAHSTPGKPIASGALDPGSVWFAVIIAILLIIPLSMTTGITAGINYLISLVIGVVGNVVLRRGKFSWVPWALSFGLLPAYLSFGGWGGAAEGNPPEIAMTVLAALLGVGVHFLRSIWGLVVDNEDGWTYWPLKLGLKWGATKLLLVGSAYTGLVLLAMAIVGATVGLSR